MGALMQTSTILAGINIGLLLGLLVVYVRNFLKMKLLYTAGFILFTALFLIHNIMYFYFSITMMEYFAAGLDFYVFLFTALQSIAFGILTFLAWRY